MKPTNLAKYMSKYLIEHLSGICGLSYNTIASRRDSYMLLLVYLKEVRSINPDTVEIPKLDKDMILAFLDWLENKRNSSIATRNLRLAAIKSFFSFIQMQTPDYIHQCQQVRLIPRKKEPEHPLEYLTVEGIKAVLAAVDTSSDSGLRDLTLLSLMYDSAARVQEIADLCVVDFRGEKPSTLRLTGKGNKTRVIPIMDKTAQLISKYINSCHAAHKQEHGTLLFPGRNDKKLTRAGITYILCKYVTIARQKTSAIIPDIVSPHSFRHSKSIHMLEAGVPLIYIRDYLGHSQISTTEIYARCNSEQKRKAIETACVDIIKPEVPMWHKDGSLMEWLQSL